MMTPTSLQNIITRSNSSIRENEVAQLFSTQEYPRFELKDLNNLTELMKNDHFAFFIRVLEGWNSKLLAKHPIINELNYRKNEFIFSWLKSIAVQNTKNLNSSLTKLFEWYSENSEQDTPCILRKENSYRSRLEEWEIRNSYKSNMPLEINNYRRRELFREHLNNFTQVNSTVQSKGTSKGKGRGNSLLKDGKVLSSQNQNAYQMTTPKVTKKENNYLRGVREESQMKDSLNHYNRSKVNFFKNMTKNYYKREFSKDKRLFSKGKRELRVLDHFKAKGHDSDDLKSYRIKTSLGFRPFKDCPSSYLSQTTYSDFHTIKVDTTFQAEADGNFPSLSPSPEKQKDPMCFSSIQGMGLLVNPFDIKIKKKKK